ncbi:hypothetical protein [uncultured Amphritea sp.]|uniref:hypothetical protein n=1 Tax=uncultured Amphritea sp. TaxID=981605 RepID=UPI0026329B2A|nr:hypothetical protein [uncultured Amphritea sp.]
MNSLYQAGLKVAVTAQVRFLEELLRRWLIGQGSLCGHIKFLYRIEFQKDAAVYVGTGSAARLASRVSGKVLQYDNSDLETRTNVALEAGQERQLVCAGLFQVRYSNDIGSDIERLEKRRCQDAGLILLNRNDIYRPVGNYHIVSSQAWLKEAGTCLYHQLGKGDIKLRDALLMVG